MVKRTSKKAEAAEEEPGVKKQRVTRGSATEDSKKVTTATAATATKKAPAAKGKAKAAKTDTMEEEDKKVKEIAQKKTSGRSKKAAAAKEEADDGEKEDTTTTTAAAAPAKAARGKGKAKSDDAAESSTTTTTAAATKTAASTGKIIPVDPNSGLTGSVHQDFDCMLNQVNIGQNNNKFYKIQLVENGGRYTLYTRWGRVGEIGQHQMKVFTSAPDGEKAFKAQFRLKTQNDWDKRDKFVKVQGKYMLLLMDASAEPSSIAAAAAKKEEEEEDESDIAPSSLDPKTQEFITFIFDKNMFTNVMTQLKVDTKKLPLGALTKQAIEAGLDALAELEKEIKGKNRRDAIVQLCSNFYTLIPHAFPRSQVPPLITTMEGVQEKYDMLNVLLDIENAQGLEKKAKAVKKASTAPKKPNPLDLKYKTLNADLTLVEKTDPEFDVIKTYAENTKSGWGKYILLNVWRVDRHDEDKRFKPYDSIKNRKLLWHGTSVAVIASCLQGGLRIMPHSGGRVGKGIYLASEHGKSSGYTRLGTLNGKQVGLMFLAEAALGEEHHITVDDPSLRAPPAGKDSIIALGAQEPDQTQDTTLVIDGKKVVVPQGKPVKRNIKTNFSQTEYLLYSEAQHRIRYVCAFEF